MHASDDVTSPPTLIYMWPSWGAARVKHRSSRTCVDAQTRALKRNVRSCRHDWFSRLQLHARHPLQVTAFVLATESTTLGAIVPRSATQASRNTRVGCKQLQWEREGLLKSPKSPCSLAALGDWVFGMKDNQWIGNFVIYIYCMLTNIWKKSCTTWGGRKVLQTAWDKKNIIQGTLTTVSRITRLSWVIVLLSLWPILLCNARFHLFLWSFTTSSVFPNCTKQGMTWTMMIMIQSQCLRSRVVGTLWSACRLNTSWSWTSFRRLHNKLRDLQELYNWMYRWYHRKGTHSPVCFQCDCI